MPYQVFFTDQTLNPEPLEVQDNTSNVDTSITIPGRNVTGYGKIIAENFVRLLENFASDVAPPSSKAVIGQLWYNSNENNLKVFDGIDWKPTSGISTSPTEPQAANVGDLWVNNSTQQLYLWSGSTWVLVGPQFSEGTKSGPLVESLLDIDNRTRTVIIFYTRDIPVVIISKDTFIPKVVIQGFTSVQTGINITTRTDISEESVIPKLIGRATSADALAIGTAEIPSTSFIRRDQIETISAQFNVRDDSGLFIGTNGNFNLAVKSANAVLYNSTPGGSIDIQSSRTGSFGVPTTVIRVIEDKIGVNNATPTATLDIIGTVKIAGTASIIDESNSTNLLNGSFVTQGGMAVNRNLNVGGDLSVLSGSLFTKSIKPLTASETIGELGNRYKVIYADQLVANTFTGTLTGNISGTANSATSLTNSTNFKLEGDVSSNVLSFNGTGNLNKTFTTTLTSDIISNKASLGVIQPNDELLVYRNNTGLRKVTRQTFLDDAAVPIGSVFPYAGTTAPTGYLLCDGGEFELYRYRELGSLLGTTYNGSAPLLGSPKGPTFRVPDLRGRFVLGKQNMDNETTVPYPGGATAPDAGGGLVVPPRVTDGQAAILGGTGGDDQYVIEQYNIPDHDHDLVGRRSDNTPSGSQFYVINDMSSAQPTDSSPFTLIGGSGRLNERTKAGTVIGGAQKMSSSGLVRINIEDKRTPGNSDSLIGRPFNVMNPFITMNYIIRSGKPSND